MLQVVNDSMNKHTQYMDNVFVNDKNLQIQASYNVFNMDAYLDWEMTMDKKFARLEDPPLANDFFDLAPFANFFDLVILAVAPSAIPYSI
jgi:hypothetical protein